MGLADHEGTYQENFPLNAVFETAQEQLKTLKGFVWIQFCARLT